MEEDRACKKKKKGFPGGVHPTDGSDKQLTMELPVRAYWPDTVTILAEQSFGGKCGLTVKPGDRVQEGDQIGKPEAFMAAPLHASVSGEVLEIKEVENQGRKVTACIIRREGEPGEESREYEKKLVNIDDLDREAIIAGIRDGGLTGMEAQDFPLIKNMRQIRR